MIAFPLQAIFDIYLLIFMHMVFRQDHLVDSILLSSVQLPGWLLLFSPFSKSLKEEKFDTPQKSTSRALAVASYSYQRNLFVSIRLYDCMNYEGYLVSMMNLVFYFGTNWILGSLVLKDMRIC